MVPQKGMQWARYSKDAKFTAIQCSSGAILALMLLKSLFSFPDSNWQQLLPSSAPAEPRLPQCLVPAIATSFLCVCIPNALQSLPV